MENLLNKLVEIENQISDFIHPYELHSQKRNYFLNRIQVIDKYLLEILTELESEIKSENEILIEETKNLLQRFAKIKESYI